MRYPGKVAGASGTGGGHPAGGSGTESGGIYSGRLHLMFLPFYHRTTSTVDVQLATSRDGRLWSRPERVPIIERGEYECVYSRRDLVALTDEEWGLPFQGTHHRHDFKTYDSDNDPYQAETSSIEWRWALWKRDRLVALEAQAEARFTIVQRRCNGTEMHLNLFEREVSTDIVIRSTITYGRVQCPVRAGQLLIAPSQGIQYASVPLWQ